MSDENTNAIPCPCGSGKPFTACCAPAPGESPSAAVQAVRDELRQALEGRSFDSQEGFEEAAASHLEAANQRPVDDFQGLSPDQMYRLLYHPFESPELVSFGEAIEGRPEAPVAIMFAVIAEAAAEEPGIKLTPKGNLPRAVVTTAKEALPERDLPGQWRIGSVRNEEDLDELHVTRLVAGFAGLTRKYKGRLKLTKMARNLLDAGDWGGLYRRLLEAYCRELNWAYRDGHPDLPLIQDAAVFSLYLFHSFGDEWRSQGFYEGAFLRAFPDVVREVPADEAPWRDSPERQVARAWTLRTVHRFGHFFGLLEVRGTPKAEGALPDPLGSVEVRKSPLFDRAVQWRVDGG